MLSITIAIAYLIALSISTLLTIVAGIVWLFLKPPAKATCGNILIVIASICALLGLVSNPLADYLRSRGEMAIPKTLGDTGELIARKADATGNAIEKAEAAELVKSELPFLAPFTEFLAMPSKKEAQDKVKEFFKKLPPEDKHRARIIERQNIFEHEAGLPFTIDSEEESAGIRRSDQRFIALIQSVDKPISTKQLPEAVASTTARLPDGFYKYSLLKTIYTSAKDVKQLQILTTEHQARIKQRMHKMLAGMALSYATDLAGFVVLIIFANSLRAKRVSSFVDAPPQGITLRQTYCFALGLYFAQFCASLPLGIIAAVYRPFAVQLSQAAIPMTTVTLGANLLLLILCARWFIFKPLELKTIPTIQKMFSGNLIKAIALGAGAFCAVKALVTLFQWLVYLIFRHAPSTNNSVVDQITTVALDPNAINLILLWLTVALFAPLAEEFAFRGLLYNAIKSRAGVFAGIVFSSAIFAAYHMDPGSFMGLFGIGIGLAFLFERAKSLLPSVFMHAMWNSSYLLLAWLMT